jgi:DNA-directed RNA polymerase subunit RPC12/RpoP
MKPRQELICWTCKEQFSVPLPAKIPDNLTVECPYCPAECVIDFKAIGQLKTVRRGEKTQRHLEGQYQLPEIMKTKQAE